MGINDSKNENLKQKIKNYEYISFDLFDTLVSRNLPMPADLFKIIEIEIYKENISQDISWHKKRLIAEKKARKMSKSEEIEIDDIYKYIDDNENNKANCLIREQELEIELSSRIEENCKLLNWCINEGKKILITSDMYLPKFIIEKILEKNEINYDKLYLSSERKCTKESGNLYKYILNDLKIDSKQIFHIGDNYQSDYCIPMMMGISAKCVPKISKKYRQIIRIKDFFSINCINNFIRNKCLDNYNYYYSKGYEAFGPLLYGYSKWLDVQFEKEGFKNILFLSRDGYIMQKAFNMISEKKTEYFYASRRALIVPTIWKCKNLSEIKKIMNFPRQISVESFFEKIGLNSQDYIQIVKKYNYRMDDILTIAEINEKKLKFYKDIEEDIFKNSKEEYSKFLSYLNKKNTTGKTAIVDIGWHGNMQNSIDKIIQQNNLNIELYGYYIGIVPTSEKQLNLNMKGFLFEKNKPYLYYNEVFFNSLFELIFMAPHGSVKKYLKDDIEFYPDEYIQNQSIRTHIEYFQKGALDFIRDMKNSSIEKYIDFNEFVSSYNIFELGNNPTKGDIDKFGDFIFYDDGIHKLVDNKSIIDYIKNYKMFIEDFRNSHWKSAFLKKTFKLNLNYFEIIKNLKKISDKRRL